MGKIPGHGFEMIDEAAKYRAIVTADIACGRRSLCCEVWNGPNNSISYISHDYQKINAGRCKEKAGYIEKVLHVYRPGNKISYTYGGYALTCLGHRGKFSSEYFDLHPIKVEA